jgi:hypothetical protein
MESERLYINNKLIELSTQTQQFARYFTVNDILSLDDRQTNFTKNIRIARTPSNITSNGFFRCCWYSLIYHIKQIQLIIIYR